MLPPPCSDMRMHTQARTCALITHTHTHLDVCTPGRSSSTSFRSVGCSPSRYMRPRKMLDRAKQMMKLSRWNTYTDESGMGGS